MSLFFKYIFEVNINLRLKDSSLLQIFLFYIVSKKLKDSSLWLISQLLVFDLALHHSFSNFLKLFLLIPSFLKRTNFNYSPIRSNKLALIIHGRIIILHFLAYVIFNWVSKREVSRCNRIIKAASQHLISQRVSPLMMLETGRLISMWGAGCHLPGGAAGHWNNGVMTRHHQRVPVWSISLDDRSIQRFSICWPLSLSSLSS